MGIFSQKRLKNLGCGWLYSYTHFVTEVICFFCLSNIMGDSWIVWFLPLVFDALAFVPQSLIGALSDRFPNMRIGVFGAVCMAAAGAVFWIGNSYAQLPALVLLCLGNACVHVNGAEVTLRSSNGRLSHSAIFVAGGSFGVITGKLLASGGAPYWIVIALVLTSVPFILLAETYRDEADKHADVPCAAFQYHSTKVPPWIVILLAVFIVIVRGYMGYGIPTTWKKTVFQNVLLYTAMGVGKASGGLLADAIGVKKTALFSAVAAVPFLLMGDRRMVVSLIGVFFFSMTMSITLAVLVSVLQRTPGLAFGLTTIGLFLGTAPIFFFKFTTVAANSAVILLLTAVSVAAMCVVIRKDVKTDA